MSNSNKYTIFPELNQLRKLVMGLQDEYSDSKPELAKILSDMGQASNPSNPLDQLLEKAQSPLSKQVPDEVSSLISQFKEAMAMIEKGLSDKEGRASFSKGNHDTSFVQNFGSKILNLIATILETGEGLVGISFGAEAIRIQHLYENYLDLLNISLNKFFEFLDYRNGSLEAGGSLDLYLDELGGKIGQVGKVKEMKPVWEMTKGWLARWKGRKQFIQKISSWVSFAKVETSRPKNVDKYKQGNQIARIVMTVGKIQKVALKKGRIPRGLELKNNGKLVVSDPEKLFPGVFSGIKVEVTNEYGFVNIIDLEDIVFSEDLDSYYKVHPSGPLELIQKGQLLALPKDPGGVIAGAEVISGNFPPGAKFDTETGRITVYTPALVRPGEYAMEIITYDQHDGETIHDVVIIYEGSATDNGDTDPYTDPNSGNSYTGDSGSNSNVDPNGNSSDPDPGYNDPNYSNENGDATNSNPDAYNWATYEFFGTGDYSVNSARYSQIGKIEVLEGGLESITLRYGSIPAGVGFRSSGIFYISSPPQLVPGTYSFTMGLQNNNGKTMDITISLTFN